MFFYFFILLLHQKLFGATHALPSCSVPLEGIKSKNFIFGWWKIIILINLIALWTKFKLELVMCIIFNKNIIIYRCLNDQLIISILVNDLQWHNFSWLEHLSLLKIQILSMELIPTVSTTCDTDSWFSRKKIDIASTLKWLQLNCLY